METASSSSTKSKDGIREALIPSVVAELMSELMEMNTVKYSAYRLALKLRRVQQRLCLDLLDLEAAVLGFDMHGLTPDRYCSFLVAGC